MMPIWKKPKHAWKMRFQIARDSEAAINEDLAEPAHIPFREWLPFLV
jgi:hypothetical protein